MTDQFHFPTTVPRLEDNAITLRELAEDDIPSWYERATDAESAALAGDPIPESPAMGFAWLERSRERFRRQEAIRWAIVPHDASRSIGSIGLTIASREERTAALGLVIGRAHWGKGMGTAATALVARYAFDILGLTEIGAELLHSNLASKRMLEKSGFRLQCEIPEFDRTDDGFVDGYRFVLRRADLCPDGRSVR